MNTRTHALLLLALGLIINGCSKPEPPATTTTTATSSPSTAAPPPTYYSICGTVAPAKGCAAVHLLNLYASAEVTAIPDSSGSFCFNALLPGRYAISYVAARGFARPADTVVDLINKNVSLGVVNIRQDPLTSKIEGVIRPAFAARIRLLNGWVSFDTTITPDAVTGKFSLGNLPAGLCGVSFLPNGIYSATSSSRTVTLTSGQTLDIGLTAFYPTPNMTFTLDTLAINLTGAFCVYQQSSFKLTASYRPAPACLDCATSFSSPFSLLLDDVTGPGTYRLKGTSTSFISYGLGIGYGPWSTLNNGSGTVTITALDTLARTVTGTFSAVMPRNTPGGPVSAIGKGSFYAGY